MLPILSLYIGNSTVNPPGGLGIGLDTYWGNSALKRD